MNKVRTLIKLAEVFWLTITEGNKYLFIDEINEELDTLIDLIRGDL